MTPPTDIPALIAELRDNRNDFPSYLHSLCRVAADEIERLKGVIASDSRSVFTITKQWKVCEAERDALSARVATLEESLQQCSDAGVCLNREVTSCANQLSAARAQIAALTKYKQRLEWLHDCSAGNLDSEDCEWGIYRVKWSSGKPIEVWQTNSDFSDLDAEMQKDAAKQGVQAPVDHFTDRANAAQEYEYVYVHADELAALREDKARLDWLQTKLCGYGFEDIQEGNEWKIDGPYLYVRDAIDAARKPNPSEIPNSSNIAGDDAIMT